MSVTRGDFKVMTSVLANKVNMNNVKLYKKVVTAGAEELIRDKIEEICCNEQLSVEEVLFCL